MEKYYLFYLLALISEVIGTVSGFGSSILFVPIASLFFDFKVVLGITALFHVFSNISKIVLFRQGIDKNIAFKLGIPAVIFVIIGAILNKYISQREIELLMSILLIGLSVFLLIYSEKTLAQTNQSLFLGGGISGFLAGLIGTGGAIRGLTLMAFNLEKNIFIATSALIDLGVDSSRAVVYFLNGYMATEFLFTIPFLLIISIVGTWLGKKIINKIPQTVFRYIVLIVIIITSIVQTVKYIYS
ncbi:sulfite exporter TauE/SafE family protein [Arcicella lustrica]|uniref:Probable membrane transporter protein n=1 Tax=Arcicella lustrica TaxID=2984196 RepID=A0ABU5SCV8_9BACT|nr:sulfite exporter TauE/SafE family protein [Arcicella sp. DC25W]MEA5425133.1 sulfite exporter TauE/SafE family protein [Arcicella sp. DC25W]